MAAETFQSGQHLIRRGERVASAGSCFASNIVPFLEKNGINYVRTERQRLALGGAGSERFGYAKFSAAYGNIYTPRQLIQLIDRATGRFRPSEDRWYDARGVIDPFRPGLRHPARNDREFEALRRQHLSRTLEAIALADVFVLTLGLTEAWTSLADGAVFPACPGTVAGVFDPGRHAFRNFSVSDVSADLQRAITVLREVNPRLRIILTVSPVPLVATATDSHVLVASTYSKAVLRVAAEEAAHGMAAVAYFPALEIVTGPQAPHGFFEPDRRAVSPEGVATVMAAFLSHCECDPAAAPPAEAPRPSASAALSAAIVAAECEEEAMDPRNAVA